MARNDGPREFVILSGNFACRLTDEAMNEWREFICGTKDFLEYRRLSLYKEAVRIDAGEIGCSGDSEIITQITTNLIEFEERLYQTAKKWFADFEQRRREEIEKETADLFQKKCGVFNSVELKAENILLQALEANTRILYEAIKQDGGECPGCCIELPSDENQFKHPPAHSDDCKWQAVVNELLYLDGQRAIKEREGTKQEKPKSDFEDAADCRCDCCGWEGTMQQTKNMDCPRCAMNGYLREKEDGPQVCKQCGIAYGSATGRDGYCVACTPMAKNPGE